MITGARGISLFASILPILVPIPPIILSLCMPRKAATSVPGLHASAPGGDGVGPDADDLYLTQMTAALRCRISQGIEGQTTLWEQ
jgi:hypothetical protein